MHANPTHSSPDPSPLSEGDTSRAQKKLKITASNGWRTIGLWAGKNPHRASVLPKRLKPEKMKMKELPSLPLDILFEIFGHLHPLDLLNLARSAKLFRRVLIHKSSKSVWKDARRNIENLPDCPPDMSEPAYINLVFDTHCHNCFRSNIRNVDWKLRVRYCTKCSKSCLLPFTQFKDENQLATRCLSFAKWPGRNEMTFCTVAAKEALLREFEKIEHRHYHDFILEKQVEREAIMAHAEKCEKWAGMVQRTRLDELDELREDRKDEIWERLFELGWEEELKEMPYEQDVYTVGLTLFDDLPCVKVPKPITDRVWKNILPELTEFMETMRSFRLERERIELLKTRRLCASKVLSEFKRSNLTVLIDRDALMPGPPEFWRWHPVKQIIESDREVEVTSMSFGQILEDIPAWMLRWRVSRTQDIIFKQRYSSLPYVKEYSEQINYLQLAISVFVCNEHLCYRENGARKGDEDYRYMYYPEYMHHRCNSVRWKEWAKPDDEEEALSFAVEHVVRTAWTCKNLEYDEKAARVVQKILDACGWDWKTMTTERLDQLDPRLVCLKCSWGNRCDGDRIMTVRSWRSAVVHCMKKHWGSAMVEWEKINETDAAEAMQLEKSVPTSALPDTQVWRCAHCRHMPQEPDRMTHVNLVIHLRNKHNRHGQPNEGTDMVCAKDAIPFYPTAVTMVPKSTIK